MTDRDASGSAMPGGGVDGPAAIDLDVVVRCRNEMPHARRTLEGLASQRGVRARVLFLDCASTDGSLEAARDAGARVLPIVPGDYVPGAVLNLGMRETASPLVAFVNADAVPLESDALERLLEPFAAPDVAASFARQVARPGADRQTRLDYARAFGDAPSPMQHGVFFSMAASAIRREVWRALPFDERLRYSEDADWTQRAGALGWRAVYMPASRFEHSHDYDLPGQLKRRAGEGKADTAIFRLGAPSPVRELLRPLAGSVLRDLRGGVIGVRPALVRASQALGRYRGRLAKSELERPPAEGALRFTMGGDPGAEKNLAMLAEKVADRVQATLGAELRSLALVGSYARGEGGAVERPGEPGLWPYNDLDFVAVVPSGARKLRKRLHALCAAWTRELGIDVDVWPANAALLESPPATLFWLDVSLGGARVLRGDSLLFKRLKLAPRQVPLDEAGRLLANRATGLALSNLEAGDEPMLRHAHKSALACGDALLLAADRYRPNLRARLEELRSLEAAPGVGPRLVERYADALRYRERPDRWRPNGLHPGSSITGWYAAAREELAGWHLAFESFRRGAPREPAAFAKFAEPLYPRLPDVRAGGALLASLRASAQGGFPLFPFLGHPRERLARASVALAYGHRDPPARGAAAALLGLPANAADDHLARRLRELTARAG